MQARVRPLLAPRESLIVAEGRRAVLATTRPDGRPRLVPITYAADLERGRLYTPIDDKRKVTADPRRLARVRDILARPQVSLLIDRWSEDWRELAWLRLDGAATVLDPADRADGAEHARAVGLLRDRYRQYADHRLEERPIIRIAVGRGVSWAAEP